MPEHRRHYPRRVVATWAVGLLCALLLTGCTTPVPGFDPQQADVVAQRGAARLLAADRLSVITGGRPSLASARIDSCVPGQDSLERRDPWAQRCTYGSSTAVAVDRIDTAVDMLAAGLDQLGCPDPERLRQTLAQWSGVNPGEPGPDDPAFSAAVLPPQVHRCGEAEVWIRFTTPDDPLLETTVAAAARTTDPLVVSARPYTDAEMRAMRTAPGEVIVLVTVWRLYHQEPR